MAYESVIGLEIHAELKTKTKIFCSCSTKFGAKPNENTCPVCMGLPGTLPVLNEEVINLAVKAGKALNCKINKISKMDRKNYFYPDLPKAYQISQFDLPICSGGGVEIETKDGKKKTVRLNRIHIEEDAGKLVHLEYEPYSLIDYNRVGVPLIEIVTEPDISSPEEAVEFLKNLKSILAYAEVSDCRMEEGSLRCDANISLREAGTSDLNCKVEIKNINSFKEVQKALEKEEKRQKQLYEYGEGDKIKQETRRYDSAKARTLVMRTKEDSDDYRYFPDPDLRPIEINDSVIENAQKTMPELPKAKKKRFLHSYELTEKEVDILIGDKYLAHYFEELVSEGCNSKTAANWILGDLFRLMKNHEGDFDDIPVKEDTLAQIIKMVDKGDLSTTAGKEVFEEVFKTGKSPDEVVEEKGLKQINNEDEIEKAVIEAMENNPQSVADYKAGKKQSIGFLIGQVMKATKGKANPPMVKEMLEKKLK